MPMMTPRHAAALALVGWYLMMPPPAPRHESALERSEAYEGKFKVLIGAPMSLWSIFDSFDNVADFHMVRDGLIARSQRDIDAFLSKVSIADQMKYFAQCIASDDPRLAK
jgi:hypothetical protein